MLREWQRKRRFERVIRPHVEQLRRFARKLERDGDEAEDLLQEALLQGLMRLDQLKSDAAGRVWISRVLYRTFLNRCRKRRADRTEAWSEQAERVVIPFPGPDARLADKRLAERMASALAQLPEQQRQAVWLVDVQGFKFSEAAEILDVRPGTVASRVARGRSTLRRELVDIARDRGVIS
jgi:RNA polymerase sigma-70 factor (ECF subfamily)